MFFDTMKNVVREHINEKFFQDSDPISDMNIRKPDHVFFHFWENHICNWAVDLKYPITFIK